MVDWPSGVPGVFPVGRCTMWAGPLRNIGYIKMDCSKCTYHYYYYGLLYIIIMDCSKCTYIIIMDCSKCTYHYYYYYYISPKCINTLLKCKVVSFEHDYFSNNKKINKCC